MTKRKPKVEHRVHIALKAPRRPAALIPFAQMIHDQMAGNVALFPQPDPPLIDVQSLIQKLKAAASHAETGPIGSAGKRDYVVGELMEALRSEAKYVEKIAVADPEHAAVIASQAGMRLVGRSFIYKPTLALKPGLTSGSLHAYALAIAKAVAYDWQLSTDDRVTWVDLTTTTRADTVIGDLQPGSTVWVRFRALRRGSSYTDWCPPVSTIVV